MTWARLGLAIAVLALGGAQRWRQEVSVQRQTQLSRRLPAPLAGIPLKLGAWQGRDAELDPVIARATGAVDQIKRLYQDSRTGAELEVIVLFGPPDAMFIHAPENCYPASGFRQIEKAAVRPVSDVPFRTLVYAKGLTDRQEVYYSWRLNDQWVLDPGNFKDVQRAGGMIKVQIGRVVSATERTGHRLRPDERGNPSEDFLLALLPELQRLDSPNSERKPSRTAQAEGGTGTSAFRSDGPISINVKEASSSPQRRRPS